MKVLLHYEDIENTALHKSLKITLPKSWKSGPTSKLLDQFVETYNGNEALGGGPNPLNGSQLHLAVREHDGQKSILKVLPSDAIVLDCIPDRADVFVMHGAAQTVQQIEEETKAKQRMHEEERKNTVQCTRFGCRNRFPRGGPYPECLYHKSPPVFHETAKFWSCCPHKKAYDWETFQEIPGCETGVCTEVKENEGKLFLGGTDLREQAGETVKLKSIDDFNKSQAAGGSEAAPVLDRLRSVLEELGIEKELFDQVVNGLKHEALKSQGGLSDAELLEVVKGALGIKLKASMKTIAAEQLRIK